MKATVIVLATSAAFLAASAPEQPKPIRLARAVTCFKTGENAPSGSMYKDCYYDCLGSPVTISIRAYAICPITIQR